MQCSTHRPILAIGGHPETYHSIGIGCIGYCWLSLIFLFKISIIAQNEVSDDSFCYKTSHGPLPCAYFHPYTERLQCENVNVFFIPDSLIAVLRARAKYNTEIVHRSAHYAVWYACDAMQAAAEREKEKQRESEHECDKHTRHGRNFTNRSTAHVNK